MACIPPFKGEPEEPLNELLEGEDKEEGGDEEILPPELEGLPDPVDPCGDKEGT